MDVSALTHNTLCSTPPAYLHFLLNYHTPTRSLPSANANLLSVPRVRTTFASRGFSVAAPQPGTHSHLAFATLPLHILSVAFLNSLLPAGLRLSLAAHPSASDSATG